MTNLTQLLEKAKVIEKDVSTILRPLKKDTSKIFVLGSEVDDHGTMLIKLCGGLNGDGNWVNYLSDLAQCVECLGTKYNVWVMDIHTDGLDDVFYVRLGIEER